MLSFLFIAGVVVVSHTAVFQTSHAADPWYDNAWLFRRAITVTNPNASVLTNFQVEVALNSSNFSFSEVVPNGADIRITDISGVIQPHWIEKFNTVTQTGKIWVKVASIPASGSKTLYVYYGNPLAAQASDGTLTFPFFDDFDDGDAAGWTKNLVSEGFSSALNFYSGKVGILVQSVDYGNIRKQYTGTLVGKTVEGNLEYGFPNNGVPNSTSTSIGESFHPKLSVYVNDANMFSVGGVQWSAGTLPVNNLRRQIDNLFTLPAVNTPIFSYGIGDVVVNRISFPNASTVESALRADASSTWEGTATDAYTVSDLDNAFVVIGKQPESSVALGGGVAYNTWDWVRIREYAATEPTTSVGSVEAQRLQAQLQLDTSMPGAFNTQYTFTVTPNMPIPTGGSLDIVFPTAFTGRMSALTPSSVSIAAHAQVTATTSTINTGPRTIHLAFTSSAPIVAPIVITVGDGGGVQGDIRNPADGGPHTISFTSFDTGPSTLATGQLTMSTANWFNTSWLYRKSLHVNNAKVSSVLPTYQVQLRLNNTNFDFTHAQSAGQDLRFVTPTGTVLPYWVESYDNIGQTAVVWIKMTSIPANTEQMIFLYHGNPAAAAASNGFLVFDFFDDFEDNDVSDWTTYSATPGAITVVGGTVKINELQNTRAFFQKSYVGSLDGKALEGVIRYINPAIGEEYSPSLGYVVVASPTTQVMIAPRNYNAGLTPTDRLGTWRNSVRYEKLGTNYTTGEDIVYSLNLRSNYFIAQTRRYVNAAWDIFDTNLYDQSQISTRSVHFGKRAWSNPSLDLNTGPLAEHQWKSVRLRDFVYFEPATLLGAEETNSLPEQPTQLFINTAVDGADTQAPDPLNLTTKNLVISAIFQAALTLEQGTQYDYQVATDAGFTTIVDSASLSTLTTFLNDNVRSEDIALTAASLNFNTDYYLRLRFYDALGHVSPYTSTLNFKIPDLAAPTISSLTPANLSIGIAANTAISFDATDTSGGINNASLSVTVNGTPAITGGVCQAGFSCSITGIPNGIHVSVTPTTPFAGGSNNTVSISVADNLANVQNATTTFDVTATAVGGPSQYMTAYLLLQMTSPSNQNILNQMFGVAGVDTALGFRCGNNTRESLEQCDGIDLAGETCAGQGYASGMLRCNAKCNFDTSSCSVSATSAGVIAATPPSDLESDAQGALSLMLKQQKEELTTKLETIYTKEKELLKKILIRHVDNEQDLKDFLKTVDCQLIRDYTKYHVFARSAAYDELRSYLFTRAEFVKFTLCIFNIDLISGDTHATFTDTSKQEWYQKYLDTAYALGIISGYGDKSFKPDQKITKAELLKILLKASKAPINDLQKAFIDVPEFAWFYPFVVAARTLDLVPAEVIKDAQGHDVEVFYPYRNDYTFGTILDVMDVLHVTEKGVITYADAVLEDQVASYITTFSEPEIADRLEEEHYAISPQQEAVYQEIIQEKLEIQTRESQLKREFDAAHIEWQPIIVSPTDNTMSGTSLMDSVR